jgi:hypothetical protein
MKGLALIMGMKPKGGPKGPPVGAEPEEEEETEAAAGGSETKFARIASEAIADGDHEAAASALVSMVKACMGSYGGKG